MKLLLPPKSLTSKLKGLRRVKPMRRGRPQAKRMHPAKQKGTVMLLPTRKAVRRISERIWTLLKQYSISGARIKKNPSS